MAIRHPDDGLGADDVLALLQSSQAARSSVLVGAQALNIWAEKRFRLQPVGVMLSEDIDFVGAPRAVLQAAAEWGVPARLPAFDDATPNTGLIEIRVAGKTRTIDFLDGVLGVPTEELHRLAVTLKTGPDPDEYLRIMHPLHCLVSQVVNAYDPRLNRRANPKGGDWIAERIRIAITVLMKIFDEYLEAGDVNTAKKMATKLGRFAREAPAVSAYLTDGIDVLDAVPLHHPGWKEDFERTVFEKYRNRAAKVRKARQKKT